MLTRLLIPALVLVISQSRASTCPDYLSCSEEAKSSDVDPCCVPSPGGLFLFKQRFEPDQGGDLGSWGIEGLDVLDCTSEDPATTTHSSTLTHEEIGSLCHRSDIFGGQDGFVKAEGEWAQSEVGEGVEEVWERSWNTAGRYISTLGDACRGGRATGTEVPEFFHVLSNLHNMFSTAKLLAEADIIPAADTTYSLAELVSALSSEIHQPIVNCDNMTLSTILWPLNVQSSFQAGSFHPASVTRKSSCPSEGIIYPPSTTRPKPTPTHSWDPLGRRPPRPITLSHDESRLYYQNRDDPKKLGFFKDADEGREQKVEGGAKKFRRDEL